MFERIVSLNPSAELIVLVPAIFCGLPVTSNASIATRSFLIFVGKSSAIDADKRIELAHAKIEEKCHKQSDGSGVMTMQ